MSGIVRFIKDKALFLGGYLNYIVPKQESIIIVGNNSIEANAVELANYLSAHYTLPVYFVISKALKPEAYNILNRDIHLVNFKSLHYIRQLIRCKYIFATHDVGLHKADKNHVFVNVWHGIALKKIRKARGEKGIPADFTVATSEVVKQTFVESFGVPPKSVLITGYPRNDLMLRAQQEKMVLKNQLSLAISSYNKLLIWLPTFRRKGQGDFNYDMSLDNVFNIPDFDVRAFNAKLKAHNALCFIKPHYFYHNNNRLKGFSHIKMIDDHWLLKQNMTLYHLLACTDILISDYSSVMLDYILLDQPVICFSKDLTDYKKTQGLNFEDIENWLPSKMITEDAGFLAHLEILLRNSTDPYEEQRQKVTAVYYNYKDTKSCQRLAEAVLNDKFKQS